MITIRCMEQAVGPAKVCPECKNPVFEEETVCGFCGHIFGAASVWPKTYRYATWGTTGLCSSALFCALAVAALGAIGFLAGVRRPGSEGVIGAAIAVPVACLAVVFCYLMLLARNGSVTFEADRVEWTTALGKKHIVSNTDLSVVEYQSFKSGPSVVFGRKGGPRRTLTPALAGYEQAVAELKQRAAA